MEQASDGKNLQVAILLYNGMTALDAIGPYEVLQAPGLKTDVRFVAREKGVKRTDFGKLRLTADYTLDETPHPDILVVPGTAYPQALMGDQQVLDWIAQVHKTTKWTTSVCTGALGLAAACVLRGLKATTHWLAHDVLKQFGATPMKERVVRDGKVFTAAGVSSGIDMALTLVAEEFSVNAAQLTQLLSSTIRSRHSMQAARTRPQHKSSQRHVRDLPNSRRHHGERLNGVVRRRGCCATCVSPTSRVGRRVRQPGGVFVRDGGSTRKWGFP